MSSFVHRIALMDTVVSFHVPLRDASRARVETTVGRAVAWFREVEARCSRFVPTSEVSQLATRVGKPVLVSELLFQAVQFSLTLAEESGGAFDPTVGAAMEQRGFNIEHRTGGVVRSAVATERVTFRDVCLDAAAKTITLGQPLMLDLGSVVKGLAVDLAARELAPLQDFLIDAGGDVYASGVNDDGLAWSVGVRHPRDPDALIETLRVTNAAVCTSGDYDRRSSTGQTHIIDPRSGTAPGAVASATVVAPSAMVADGLATAAFVLGPVDGVRLLDRHGVRGFLITPDLQRHSTRDA